MKPVTQQNEPTSERISSTSAVIANPEVCGGCIGCIGGGYW